MNVYRMAWRNVWRNRRRSLVTIGAMTLSLFVMVLYSGLVQGMLVTMQADVVNLEVGDIQVFAPGYLDRPSLFTRISQVGPLLTRLDQAGFAAAPRLLAGALAAHGEQSAGVQLRGIDPGRDRTVSQIWDHVTRGKWVADADPRGVVIGGRLARTLGVKVGGELILLGQAADGSLANDLFHVRGILGTISDATDRAAVFVPEPELRGFLAIPHGVHQLLVRSPAGMPLKAATAEAARLAKGETVRSWRQLMPTVASMIDSAKGTVQIVSLVVYLAVAILILNAMLMAVFERIREFGVLKAIGAGPGRVLSLILLESAAQVAIAVGVGLALAVPGMWFLATHGLDLGAMGGLSAMGVAMPTVWRGVYDGASVSGPVVTLAVLALLAVLYPALKAAWVSPLKAMHHH